MQTNQQNKQQQGRSDARPQQGRSDARPQQGRSDARPQQGRSKHRRSKWQGGAELPGDGAAMRDAVVDPAHQGAPAAANERNPVTDHTPESDIESMRRYAAKFDELTERERAAVSIYVFAGQSFDYYYGSYVTTFQLYTMAYVANNDMAPALMALLHCTAWRAVTAYDERAAAGAKKEPTAT